MSEARENFLRMAARVAARLPPRRIRGAPVSQLHMIIMIARSNETRLTLNVSSCPPMLQLYLLRIFLWNAVGFMTRMTLRNIHEYPNNCMVNPSQLLYTHAIICYI